MIRNHIRNYPMISMLVLIPIGILLCWILLLLVGTFLSQNPSSDTLFEIFKSKFDKNIFNIFILSCGVGLPGGLLTGLVIKKLISKEKLN